NLPLIEAVLRGNTEDVRVLLTLKANVESFCNLSHCTKRVDSRHACRATALFIAAQKESVPLIKILSEHGAKDNKPTCSDKSAFELIDALSRDLIKITRHFPRRDDEIDSQSREMQNAQ